VKKVLFVVVVLVLAGGAAKLALAKPAPKPRVDSIVYMLRKDFVVYLRGGRYAKVTIGLTTPKGFGAMLQEGFVRDVISSDLAGLRIADLLDGKRRAALKRRMAHDITARTDVNVNGVLFSDLAIQ
jgi:hypothetical protein